MCDLFFSCHASLDVYKRQAMGYALLAADEMRLSEEQKERLWQLMYSNFDIVSEEKAEKRFREGK